MNRKPLFENVGGNAFKMAYPQPMGMMEGGMSLGKKVFRLTLARKPETNEWLVKVYVDGKYNEDATYYTDDKQDAINTAKLMAKQYAEQGLVWVGRDGQVVEPAVKETDEPPEPMDSEEDPTGDINGEIDDLLMQFDAENPDPRVYDKLIRIRDGIWNMINRSESQIQKRNLEDLYGSALRKLSGLD